MNMTTAPICKIEAKVFDDKHLKAVDATKRKRMTMMPTKVTIHMVLIFMSKQSYAKSPVFDDRDFTQLQLTEGLIQDDAKNLMIMNRVISQRTPLSRMTDEHKFVTILASVERG